MIKTASLSAIILGESRHLPDHHLPLSEACLPRESTVGNLLINPRGAYEKPGVKIISGARATGIHPQADQVQLADDGELTYGGLLPEGRPSAHRQYPEPSDGDPAGQTSHRRTHSGGFAARDGHPHPLEELLASA